jgi:hypothetical protein
MSHRPGKKIFAVFHTLQKDFCKLQNELLQELPLLWFNNLPKSSKDLQKSYCKSYLFPADKKHLPLSDYGGELQRYGVHSSHKDGQKSCKDNRNLTEME